MNATDFCSINSTRGFFWGINLETTRLIYCENMVHIRNFIYLPLLFFMIFLCILLLIITFSGQIKEDYKYFIFNAVILNLSFGCYMVCYTIFLNNNKQVLDKKGIIHSIFYQYINNLSFFACFPIAVNRFLIMYFNKYYEQFYSTMYLIGFILIFDFVMILIDFLTSFFYQTEIYLCFLFAIAILTAFLSLLIFIKIRIDSKRLNANPQTLSNMKRASIYCILQACISFINPFVNVIYLVFFMYFFNDPILYNMFIDIYIFITTMIDVIVVLSSICDFLVLLLILKSYRNAIVKFIKWMISYVKKPKIKKLSVTLIDGPARRTSLFNNQIDGQPRRNNFISN